MYSYPIIVLLMYEGNIKMVYTNEDTYYRLFLEIFSDHNAAQAVLRCRMAV